METFTALGRGVMSSRRRQAAELSAPAAHAVGQEVGCPLAARNPFMP